MTECPAPEFTGATRGATATLLRLEGLLVLGVAVAVFHALGGGWLMFAVLFLVPDLSMLGYLAGPRIGAACYKAGHSYLGPALLGAAGLYMSAPLIQQIAAIWVAHVGFDRALGYGLKYAEGFGFTHLGFKGRAARA